MRLARTPRIFFGSRETTPFLVLFCLLLASVAEVASIGSLLPALTAITGGDSIGSSPVNGYVRSSLVWLGLEPLLGNIILIAIGLMALKSLLSFGALSYAGILATRVSISLRRRLICAIFDARWSFFAEQSGGRIANSIGNDAGRAGDAYLVAAQVVTYAIQVMAYAAINFIINWRLALFGLAGGAVVALALNGLIGVSRRAGYRLTDGTARLTMLMADTLANVKPLKSMGRHHATQAKMSETLKRLRHTLVTREIAKAGLSQGSDIVLAILIGAGLYLGHVFGNTPLPELVISGIGFFQIISITTRMQRFLQQAVQLESAYVRTEELITRAEKEHEINSGDTEPEADATCKFKHVAFSHGDRQILADVTLEIPARSITVLQGPSGAGKTTIIDLVIGLHRPERGEIFIGNTPMRRINLWAWRKKIGYVPQELNLFHATVRDNITLNDASISDDDIYAAVEKAGAGAFIARLPQGLDTDVGEMGVKLSGGERQRISLARALVTKPAILILDEVTSALDPETESQIVANIAGLRGAYTIIAITHRPAWTLIADRLYDVSSGGVALLPQPDFDNVRLPAA